jgi:hypothetical protein
MAQPAVSRLAVSEGFGTVDGSPKNEATSSAVSWGAVIAGAFVTAALSLALLALGTGIGFSAVSPWANSGESSSAIGWTAVIWLIVMELIASSMGGYVTGRLRTKWVNVHAHEVYFRDTAHGFLVWAVGLVIAAAFLTSAAASMLGGSAQGSAASAASSETAQPPNALGPNGYFVDALLRPSTPGSAPDNGAVRSEVALILANGFRQGSIPAEDKSYLAQVVASKTGLSEPDAEKRLDDTFARAQESADRAREAIAHSMYWTFLALLIGAFCASFAATIGGKQRDHVLMT